MCRVGKKRASREVRIFFFLNFILYELERTGEKGKIFFLKDEKKKFYPQVLDSVGRWTGNAFLFEAGLKYKKNVEKAYHTGGITSFHIFYQFAG